MEQLIRSLIYFPSLSLSLNILIRAATEDWQTQFSWRFSQMLQIHRKARFPRERERRYCVQKES